MQLEVTAVLLQQPKQTIKQSGVNEDSETNVMVATLFQVGGGEGPLAPTRC